MVGAELAIPTNVVVEPEGGQEPTGKKEEGGKAGDKKDENEEDEESTYEAEDNDDSDHTQVPEDEEHAEVADEAAIEDAAAGEAGKEAQEEDTKEENGQENMEEESKAATILQSNFRGHKERKRLQEEGKIPAKKQKALSPTGEEEAQTVPTEEESTDPQDVADVSSIDIMLEDQDETKAAVVLQSNFRGHKERKRLEEEGKIPKRRKKEKEELPKEEEQVIQPEESQRGTSVQNSEGLDEEKAATVLQSNFRGHQERKKLKAEREMQYRAKEEAVNDTETKDEAEEGEEEEEGDAVDVTDVVIEHKDEADAEEERLEEEQAAVKIQSNFRGYKERKNLRANKQTAQTQAEQLESFSKQVTR